MAQIDLKNVTIKLKDGYGPTGFLVNLMAGYMAGASVMAVDGGTVSLAVGDTFTVAGETGTPVHTITAATGTPTTSITFTPVLAGAVTDDAAITVLPHSLSVKIGEGNLTYNEHRKIKYVMDKGKLDTCRLDDQEPVDVKLDFMWEFLKADSAVTSVPTVEDAFKQANNASGWVTSAADPCEPYAVDLELTNTPICNGVKSEVILLPDFRYEELAHDPKTGQVSVTGKCNVIAATLSRV